MKWFWYSLIVFCLFLFSCKSKKVVSDITTDVKHVSEVSYLNETVKIDSSKTAYFASETQCVVIEEDINVVEYDKESGKPIKETKTKRKTIQDTDKVVYEEENQNVTDCNGLEVEHIADVSKMIESEVKEEVKGGQESFGKWLGFILGIGIVGLIVYLCVRVNKSL